MRTTVRPDPDVAAAAERLCTERHIGLDEAVNELVRVGLSRTGFRQRTAHVGLKGDVTDVADTLELLDHHGCDHL